jgi:hypothetical protein
MPSTAAQTTEFDVAPDHVEATLNYIVDDGSKVFTITAGLGGQDVRSGGTPDPRRVTIHNGRPHATTFTFEHNGFRFVRHDTKVADFYDEDSDPAHLLPGDGSADQIRKRRQARRRIRSYTAHGR